MENNNRKSKVTPRRKPAAKPETRKPAETATAVKTSELLMREEIDPLGFRKEALREATVNFKGFCNDATLADALLLRDIFRYWDSQGEGLAKAIDYAAHG